jgi:hypothetical protein
MKTYKIAGFLSVAALVLGLSACKKYGRDFADGYDKAGANGPNITVDTNMKFVDRSAYAKARIFPGLVDISEPRVTDEAFTLDLNFSSQSTSNLRINVAPEPQFSTGYYAAPGELIKLVVPEGVNGLYMQIGGHTDNLSGKIPLLRDPVIVNKKALFPGVNYIRNLYGGTIYINAAFAIPAPVTFKISGAVRSPDFILGVDTDAGWIAKVRASKVPWLELRSKRVIFLVPLDRVLAKINAGKMSQPSALMTEWNNKFELDYNGWMGLTDNAPDIRDRSPQGAWRGVLDIQISAGYGHNGFPFMGINDDYWFNSLTDLNGLLTNDGMWGTFHEFGHNCQQPSVWSWSTLGETTNNLFNIKVANRNGVGYTNLHPALPQGIPQAVAYATEVRDGKNFDADGPMDSPFKRMTPFIQIFDLYGFGAMTKLYKDARYATRLSNNDIDKHDFVYEKLSEYTGKDLFPFFYFWGILVSEQSKAKVAAKYPMLDKAIWTYNPNTKTGGTGPITWPVSITVGAGTNSQSDGPPQNMFDGNINTIWHSQWSPANGVFPYTFNIDFRVNRVYNSISFTQRQNNSNGYVKDVELYTSNNGKDYTKFKDIVLANNISKQTFTFNGPMTIRYFRFIYKTNYYNNNNASMAEVSLNP